MVIIWWLAHRSRNLEVLGSTSGSALHSWCSPSKLSFRGRQIGTSFDWFSWNHTSELSFTDRITAAHNKFLPFPLICLINISFQIGLTYMTDSGLSDC